MECTEPSVMIAGGFIESFYNMDNVVRTSTTLRNGASERSFPNPDGRTPRQGNRFVSRRPKKAQGDRSSRSGRRSTGIIRCLQLSKSRLVNAYTPQLQHGLGSNPAGETGCTVASPSPVRSLVILVFENPYYSHPGSFSTHAPRLGILQGGS